MRLMPDGSFKTIECVDFFDLMQCYRHSRVLTSQEIEEAYQAVVAYVDQYTTHTINSDAFRQAMKAYQAVPITGQRNVVIHYSSVIVFINNKIKEQ